MYFHQWWIQGVWGHGAKQNKKKKGTTCMPVGTSAQRSRDIFMMKRGHLFCLLQGHPRGQFIMCYLPQERSRGHCSCVFSNMGHQRGGVNQRILTVGLVGFKCNQIHSNSIIYLTYTKPCPLDMHKSKDAKQTWKYISSISFLLWDYRGLHEHTVLFQRLPNLGFIFMYECLCVCTLSLLLFLSGQS